MSEGKRLIINNNFVNFNIQPPLNNQMMMNKNQNQMMPMNQMNQMDLMYQMNLMMENSPVMRQKVNQILNKNNDNATTQDITNYLQDKPQLVIKDDIINEAIKHNKEFFMNKNNGFKDSNAGFCWIMSVFKLFSINKNFLQILINFKKRHKNDKEIKSLSFDKDLQSLKFTEDEKLAAMHCFVLDMIILQMMPKTALKD